MEALNCLFLTDAKIIGFTLIWFKFLEEAFVCYLRSFDSSSHANNTCLETLQVAFDLQTNQRCKSPGFDLDTAVQVG